MKKKKRKSKKRSIFQKDDVSSAPSPQRSLRYTCDQIYDTVVSYDWIRDGWWPWWVTFHKVPDEVNTWKANALARKCTRGHSILYLSARLKQHDWPIIFRVCLQQPRWSAVSWLDGIRTFGPCPQNNLSVVFYCFLLLCTISTATSFAWPLCRALEMKTVRLAQHCGHFT